MQILWLISKIKDSSKGLCKRNAKEVRVEDIEKVTESAPVEGKPEETIAAQGGIKGFFQKHGSTIFLVGFIGYFILFLIGVIAEIFKIQSILDWWIWRPPGKN